MKVMDPKHLALLLGTPTPETSGVFEVLDTAMKERRLVSDVGGPIIC